MAHEKDWEQHARKSRHSAVLTFIGAAVVVGALVFSFLQLSSLQQQITKKRELLDKIDAEIISAQEELGQLISALKDTVQQKDQESALRAVGDVVARYNLMKNQTTRDMNRLTQEAKQPKIDKQKKPGQAEQLAPAVEQIQSGESAFIASDEDFVLCRSVNNMLPEGEDDVFPPGRVYAWARIKAPKNESLILRWLDEQGAVIRTSYLRVKKNMQTGYRAYDYKTFSEEQIGAYSVLLFNENGEKIARREFRIQQQ